MKVYTKTGDRGQTSLVGGQRVSKCCDRLESYGTVDELNSQIGLLITYLTDPLDAQFLTDVQSTLFVVGGYLATDNSQRDIRPGNIVTPEMVLAVEQEIDRIDAILPPIKLFILPGGCRGASVAHVCRCVCRRAERCILRLAECGAEIDENVTAYVNRLSDYLFILARKLNFDANHPEIIWRREK
ncbi:MAG: cob(I)yrinic acid a,c-diamide adenosyltransferase [Bacteroidaceae bacterium]|nr:cob(I)yrinic acid a,c-diamide adenosyltransferase [Bacteroidaceae bacterium]